MATNLNSINYKSFADLSNDILHALHKVPGDIDLIVGVPRSGLMTASIMALALNVRFCDIDSFIRNDPLKTGSTRKVRGNDFLLPRSARHVLVLDDSIASGGSMIEVRNKIAQTVHAGKISYMAIYATEDSTSKVDCYAQVVPLPRYFQWNLFHRQELASCCFDIDGVLCKDPLEAENDDGDNYAAFILGAARLINPTYKIGHLVTSRLEKYRPQTEKWLKDHNIEYGKLHMLNLASAEERRRQGVHASFKAKVYASLNDATLFVESEAHQALEIARLSGKPVLDFGNQVMINPGISIHNVSIVVRHWYKTHPILSIPYRIARKIKRILYGA